jgi:intermediate peptidase
MYKNTASRPWICARCLSRRSQHQNRLRSTAAAAQTYEPLSIPVNKSASRATHDDKTLRNIFDSGNIWREFSQSSKVNSSGRSNGLFQNRYLTSPKGFELFANTNLRKAKQIVDKVLRASSTEEYKTIARDLDRLSDMLCRVIDLSDFVRSTHPDHKIQAAASRAHAKMFEYMNVLNTTTGLNGQLGIAMANEEIMSGWSEEEKVVAKSLKRDFAKSAISLPRAIRERFVSLSQEISEISHVFVEDMAPAKETISIPSSKLKGMDPMLVRSLTRWGQATLPAVGDLAAAALRSVHDEDTRREIFMASKTASQKQILRLEELLRKRAELASITGYNSYSELALGDKMAKSPQSVNQFLQAVSGENRPRAQKEMGELLKTKMRDSNASTPILQPWDKEFYTSQVRSSMRSTSRSTDFLSSYFSLGTVMQGLSRLFTRLYGISFVPREATPGEAWNEDVRRLDIISETDGHVAVLYCDLFTRPGKSPNPAHFTLRCSREITDDELEEARSSPNELFSTPEEDANDGMATSRTSGVLKQLPTIALICDFRTSSKPSLLTFGEVQTLFHEMGHAIHSILGRTSLQEVSGTRCPTDFAELPSVLMEHFAADPSVLSLFARHYETDQPLPYELVAEKLALDKRFAGSDTEHQIILAMLDQAYHSSLPLSPSFDSTQVLREIQRKHGVLPSDPPGTCWQGLFGHLAGYGSTYYSYLFDQVLAERIWQVVFKSGHGGASIDRANGERMKERVLRWGGGRDPWRCVAEVLDDGRVEGGDEKAMRVVGSWWGAKGRDI